jgi:hypothetical protein
MGDVVPVKARGVRFLVEKCEGLNAMASGRPTPLGGLARLVQTMPGALANHWTSQSYQGVWGPCVSVRQTVTQGLARVRRGVGTGMRIVLTLVP